LVNKTKIEHALQRMLAVIKNKKAQLTQRKCATVVLSSPILAIDT